MATEYRSRNERGRLNGEDGLNSEEIQRGGGGGELIVVRSNGVVDSEGFNIRVRPLERYRARSTSDGDGGRSTEHVGALFRVTECLTLLWPITGGAIPSAFLIRDLLVGTRASVEWRLVPIEEDGLAWDL